MSWWLILSFILTNFALVFSIESSELKCGVKFKSSDSSDKGTASGLNEWPWLASLHLLSSDKYLCGGTIVSKHLVLTAAHCVVKKRKRLKPEAIKVYLGKHNLTSTDEKFEWFIPYQIKVHPDWKVSDNDQSFDADIAVLLSAFPIPFSKTISPICLWTDLSEDEDYIGTVVGWGEFGTKKISDVPNQLRVKRVTSARCYEDFHVIAAMASSRTFCAGSSKLNDVPCKGFSGSGFFIQENGIWFIQGIVSSTLLKSGRCNSSKYSLYTKVNEFLTWINISSNEYAIHFTALTHQNFGDDELKSTCKPLGLSVRLPSGSVNTNERISLRVDRLEIDKQDVVYFPYGFNVLYPNLIRIEIKESNLKFVDRKSFEKMDQVIEILIQQNPISSIPHDTFYEAKNLTNLWINNCKIRNLHPDTFAKSLNLEVLGLDDNQLEFLPSDLLRNNLNLEQISAYKNRIKFIDNQIFANLKHLEYINFNQNFLHNISENAFHDLKSLTALYLEHNRLKSLPAELLSNNFNLEHFDVKYNQIDSIERGIFYNKPELNWISLQQNNVKHLEENIFEGQTRIKELSLNGMRISELPTGLFKTLTNLTKLSIRTNELTTLDKNLLSKNLNLLEFTADYNWIEDLDPSFFENNAELNHISLSNNRINSLAKGLFSNLKNLNYVDFSFNYISSISEGTFGDISNLQYIYLIENSFDMQNENFTKEMFPDTNIQYSFETEYSDEEILAFSSQWKLLENSTHEKYQRTDPSKCGKKFQPSELIVGGSASGENEWPWLASLMKSPSKTFFCGGSIISEHHVLTAAHCLHNKHRNHTALEPSEFLVYLGMHNLSTLNDNDYWFNPHEVLVHPEWTNDALRFDADIAIVVSDSPIKFSSKIAPVCLWAETEEDGNYLGTVVGWGASKGTAFVGHTEIPYQVKVKRVPSGKCYEDEREMAKIGSSRSFCASGVAEDSGPCNGDSGGGYFVEVNDVWYLQGIVSSSLLSITTFCDVSTYALYTKINEFLSWINLRNKAYEVRLRGYFEIGWMSTFKPEGLVVTQPSSNVILDKRKTMMKADMVSVAEQNVVYFPSGFGKICPTMKQIEIANSNLLFVERRSFQNMNNLLGLKIHDNPMKNLPSDAFAELTNLEILQIMRTQLVLLPEDLLFELSDLLFLNLSSNQIDSLPKGLLRNNLKLQILDLSHNQIKFIAGKNFENLEKLQELSLNNNRIQDISSKSFGSLNYLRIVKLQGNRIKTLHFDTFARNKILKDLDLRSNLIEDFPPELLSKNLKLQQLSLEGNKIKEFSSLIASSKLFQRLNELLWLDLRSMNIKVLPHDFFFDLRNLLILNIDTNRLKVLPKDLLAQNRELVFFAASFNEVKELHPDFFQSCSKLFNIMFTRNQLTSISSKIFKNLTSLTELQLSFNLIEIIAADAFSDLTSLTRLMLNNNKLKFLDENLFKNLESLTYLSMPYNQIEYLSSELLSNNHALVSIDFDENNLKTIDIVFNPNRNYKHLMFIGNKCVSVGSMGDDLMKNKAGVIEKIMANCSSRSL